MFGDKLIEQRKKCNLTQNDLALQIGTTQQVLSTYEKNKAYPSIDTLIKLCLFLNCSSDELLEIKLNPKNLIDNLYKFYVNVKINFTNDMTFLLKDKKNINEITEAEKTKYYTLKNKIILIDILITSIEELKKYNNRLMELI